MEHRLGAGRLCGAAEMQDEAYATLARDTKQTVTPKGALRLARCYASATRVGF